MGVDKPNYTQIPNLLLDDLLMLMSDAEMKVTLAIARRTFGYHRDRIEISISQLQEITHLSKQGVVNGINAGLERGTITRTEGKRGGFVYELVINGEHPSTCQRSRHVNEVDSQPSGQVLVNQVDTTSQPSRPPLVNQVDQNTPVLKKERKKTIKKKVKESIAADAAPAETPEWREFVSGLCNCCYKHTDIAALSAKDKGLLLSEAKKIHDGGYTLEDIREWFGKEWVNDWRYGAKKNRPTPSQVRSGIPSLRAPVDEVYEMPPASNGHHATSKTDRKREAFANVEKTLQERGLLG